jgi:hypothetical protein
MGARSAAASGRRLHATLGEASQKEKKRREENRPHGAKVRDYRGRGWCVSAIQLPAMEGLEIGGTSRRRGRRRILAPDFTLLDRAGRSFSLGIFADASRVDSGNLVRSVPIDHAGDRENSQKWRQAQVVGLTLEGRTRKCWPIWMKAAIVPSAFDSGNWKNGAARNYGSHADSRTFLINHEGRILFGVTHRICEKNGSRQRLRVEILFTAVSLSARRSRTPTCSWDAAEIRHPVRLQAVSPPQRRRLR